MQGQDSPPHVSTRPSSEKNVYSFVDQYGPHAAISGTAIIFHFLLFMLLSLIVLGHDRNEIEQTLHVQKQVEEDISFPEPEEIEREPVEEVQEPEPEVSEPTPEESTNEPENPSPTRSRDFRRTESNSGDDSISVNNQTGGPFGSRPGHGGGDGPGGDGGGPLNVETMEALKWLAKHQQPDGSWHPYEYVNQCTGQVCQRPEQITSGMVEENHVGTTGLSLLAFLGAGYTHLDEGSEEVQFEIDGQVYDFGRVVGDGLRWLRDQQNEDGAFTVDGSNYMYDNAIASMAVAEAWGMTQHLPLEEVAQNAMNYMLSAQNDYAAWRYTHKHSGENPNDTSVTGWAVMALKSGKLAGLTVPDESMSHAYDFVDSVTEQDYYQTGYTSVSDAGEQIAHPGPDGSLINDKYQNNPAMTAIGMMVRMFVNPDFDEEGEALRLGAGHLMDNLPHWEEGHSINSDGNPVDYYYWYYGTLALFMLGGPNSPHSGRFGQDWEAWNDSMKSALVDPQIKEGCEEGSWEPIGRWSMFGGRVYATAINALTLEVYYRYENAFGVGGVMD